MSAPSPVIPTNIDWNNVVNDPTPLTPLILYVGLPIAVALLLMILGPGFALLVWCCRCCGCCGGRKSTKTAGYTASARRGITIAFVVFLLIACGGCAWGLTSNPKIADGLTSLTSTTADIIPTVVSVVDTFFNSLAGLGPAIAANGPYINNFADGILNLLPPVQNIQTTVNNINGDLDTLNTGITTVNTNITDLQTRLTAVTNIASTYGLGTVPASNSFPTTGSAGTSLSNAQSDLSTTNNTISSMDTNIRTARNDLSNQVTSTLNSVNTTISDSVAGVRSSVDGVKTTLDSYQTYMQMSEDYMSLYGMYIRQGFNATFYAGFAIFLVGIIGVGFRNSCCMKFFAFLCFFSMFWFFLLFLIEILVGQSFSVYCANDVKTALGSAGVLPNDTLQYFDILNCDGSTTLLDILGLTSQFDVSNRVNMSDITAQASNINRTSDINNARSNLLTVNTTLGGVSINLGDISTVISQLNDVYVKSQSLTNFDMPGASPGTKITQAQINTATSTISTFNGLWSASFTLSSCANNANNAYFCAGGQSATTCQPNVASLADGYNVGTPTSQGATTYTYNCPFSDTNNPVSTSTMNSNYQNFQVLSQVQHDADIVNTNTFHMVQDLQGIQIFAGDINTFVGPTMSSYLQSINTELDSILSVSNTLGTQLSTVAQNVVLNITTYANGVLQYTRCKPFGDLYRNIESSICDELTPGFQFTGYSHLIVGVAILCAYYVGLVADKRFNKNNNNTPSSDAPSFELTSQVHGTYA